MACGLAFRGVRVRVKRRRYKSQSTFGTGEGRRPGPLFSFLLSALALP